MAGRMGGDRVTVKNLRVLQIDPTTSTLVISGALPGRPGTLVEIRSNAKLTPNNAERTRKSSV